MSLPSHGSCSHNAYQMPKATERPTSPGPLLRGLHISGSNELGERYRRAHHSKLCSGFWVLVVADGCLIATEEVHPTAIEKLMSDLYNFELSVKSNKKNFHLPQATHRSSVRYRRLRG